MVAKERLHDLLLIRLKPPLHFRTQGPLVARATGQRRKGQYGRSSQISRQKHAPRGQIRKPCVPRGCEICRIGFRQFRGADIIEGFCAIHGLQFPTERIGLNPPLCGLQRLFGPLIIGQIQQAQIKQPFARVIHNIQMNRFGRRHGREQSLRRQPERQAQLADGVRAARPLRRGVQ